MNLHATEARYIGADHIVVHGFSEAQRQNVMKQCLGRCYSYNFLFVILSLHADGHARVRQRWSANFIESQILELHLEREWIVRRACVPVEIFLDALFP